MAAARYGRTHQRALAEYRRVFKPGQLCPQVFLDGTVCRKPIWHVMDAQLGHAPWGGYLGLVHKECNLRDGAQRGNAQRGRTCRKCRRKFRPARRRQALCGECKGLVTQPRETVSAGRPW